MHFGHNIASALEQNAVRRGTHPAIVEGGRIYTYSSLDQQVRQIADYLVTLGAGEGTVVGVCLKDSAEHLMINYAIARIGAIILPLDWRWAEAEIRNVCHYFEVTVLLMEAGTIFSDF